MLVLSRRENQKILFPNLGITVEIVGMRGRNIRVGIDAPPEIRIVRAELAEQDEADKEPAGSSATSESDRQLVHQRNNQLNEIALKIQIAEKMLTRGDAHEASEILEKSLASLRDLDHELSRGPLTTALNTGNTQPKWKALLVEDDDNERQLMSSILSMCGFEVDAVENGARAIDYLQTHEQPDCVLMDMQMPQLSGQEAIAAIREQLEFTDVPIYGVSGLKRHEANVPMGDRGVTGWFAKPVDADRMIRKIMADFQASASVAEPSKN
jgi:carbon storage regulator CsrA